MKFNYDYNNGKIIALDDKVGIKEYEYQDNIDSIIAIENVIEILEKDKKSLEDKRDEKNESQKGIFWLTYLFCFCVLCAFNTLGKVSYVFKLL